MDELTAGCSIDLRYRESPERKAHIMETIDITPTREESARIIAYILASHIDGNPSQFGDYWNLTTREEEALFQAYHHLDSIDETLKAIGLGLYELPKGTKKTIILTAWKQAQANN